MDDIGRRHILGRPDWHGQLLPDRRHVRGKTRTKATRKVKALEKERDSGAIRKAGRPWTVEQWLTHWLDTIVAPSVRDNTFADYRVAVRVHLVPGVGAHRLDKLEPEHLERLYARMQRNGSAAGTAHQAHRTIRTALGEAVRRGHLARNPAALAKPPRLNEEEVEPYSVADVKRILAAAAEGRNSARWAVALALGLRQGEALGLKWSDLDLPAGRLIVRRSRQRPRWDHGCGGSCDKPKPGYCPQRIPQRADTADTKSRNGRRAIGLPSELAALLQQHHTEQGQERETAAQLWEDGDWVFATPTGRPLNPRTDFTNWKKLCAAAGVREGRLHDARHTAATVLLVLGVPQRAVMDLMGWATSDMAKRYQHITDEVRTDVAGRVGDLLWGPDTSR